jgi:hypothetical protein
VDEEISADVGLAHDSAFFGLFQSFDFDVNTIYTVDLSTGVSGSISGVPLGGRQFNSAFVDPMFVLDPQYITDGYRLEFSPGIGKRLRGSPPRCTSTIWYLLGCRWRFQN